MGYYWTTCILSIRASIGPYSLQVYTPGCGIPALIYRYMPEFISILHQSDDYFFNFLWLITSSFCSRPFKFLVLSISRSTTQRVFSFQSHKTNKSSQLRSLTLRFKLSSKQFNEIHQHWFVFTRREQESEQSPCVRMRGIIWTGFTWGCS